MKNIKKTGKFTILALAVCIITGTAPTSANYRCVNFIEKNNLAIKVIGNCALACGLFALAGSDFTTLLSKDKEKNKTIPYLKNANFYLATFGALITGIAGANVTIKKVGDFLKNPITGNIYKRSKGFISNIDGLAKIFDSACSLIMRKKISPLGEILS